MDIRKLNNTLLQTFRSGVAAALDISPQQVHINRLNEKKNCIELTVSPPPDKPGTMERLSSEEVVRSLNVNILYKSLSQFGITEITPECVLTVVASCRRGSNVSLSLDMSVLGSVDPFSAAPAPRERVAMEYLQSAHRALSRQQLCEAALHTQRLHAEFAEIPMNFVDPKELDIPSHGTKNRYKTILPSKMCRDPYWGYMGEEKTYIATQGPMINTVNDFWQMVWQEDSPVIVMITKLKEKNEKCVLYWPERRGIYGKVEVLINSVRECDHYTIRNLTLKVTAVERFDVL
ncbi:UNVERIFIED_CONTAM: hypothetical protein FKN15_049906 [Acipenser sinensis]